MTRLKEARLAAGMSQKAVADALHIAPPSVSNWESGKTNPSQENLKALSKLYHVSIDYLLGRDEEITFRIDIYARENLLYPINAALHKTMRRNGYQRYGQVQDDYLQDMDIYVKSATYTIKEQLPFPWE